MEASLPGAHPRLVPLLEGARLDHFSLLVRDREQAIQNLSMLTSGPFDRFEYTNTALVYGEPSTYTLHMALAPLSPTLDLEIIQLKSGRNEVHEKFLRERGEGLQHIAYEVEDFDASIAAFRAAGFHPMLQKLGGTPVAIYMDTTALGGFFVELIRKGFRMRDPATWPK
ncbi:VOC family protein [Hydrogenophaga sp.]|jgi:catechol 2,3-dioxygenase-like lactoylglutathione lyase family enzyme|uniref:VOC family protein n=1 Tax=Hydrogenophaga sp. TaxID=1904254 RepID=UPI003F72B3D9